MKKFKKNNKVDIKNKLKNKMKLIPYGTKEILFNVLSIVTVIGVLLYFGARSFYYYSMQNVSITQALNTLNGTIITNVHTVADGDGLHQDTDGYYFKGNVSNNYVQYGNRLFRVIRINNDGSIKVITNDIVSEFMWGEDNNYQLSNIREWLEKQDDKMYSGIYYDTLPSVTDFLVKTNYNIPIFDGTSVINGKEEYSDYITTLSIKDYSNANGKNSYLNIGKYFWLYGVTNDNSNLYVGEDGTLLTGNLYESYGVRAVMTFKNDIEISGGNGSIESPYIINQGDKTNFVDGYVSMGGEIWKVFYHKEGFVKLAYTDSIAKGANLTYSDSTSKFNPKDKDNIAYFLNNKYYSSLAFKDYLSDVVTFTGEVSSDTSLYYGNTFNDYNLSKVTLLNLFDYNNLGLDNYYLANTTSTIGSMVYVYHNYGLLEEASIDDVKNIIPVICLREESINTDNGDGTIANPYTLR